MRLGGRFLILVGFLLLLVLAWALLDNERSSLYCENSWRWDLGAAAAASMARAASWTSCREDLGGAGERGRLVVEVFGERIGERGEYDAEDARTAGGGGGGAWGDNGSLLTNILRDDLGMNTDSEWSKE